MTNNANAIAKWCSHRHQHYCNLMRRIHTVIIHMMHANAEHRNKRQTATNPFATKHSRVKKLIPQSLQYGNFNNARKLQFKPVPIGVHRHSKYQTDLNTLRDFLATFPWELVDNNQTGITWMKLFVALEASGTHFTTTTLQRTTTGKALPLRSTKATYFDATVAPRPGDLLL